MTAESASGANRSDRLRDWDRAGRPIVTPSMLSCDFARPGEELRALAASGVVGVHLDVMDGHFVPNISYGAPVISGWRGVIEFAFDLHLMIDDPGRYLDDFVKAGCDLVNAHIEVLVDPRPFLSRVREAGCRASLALNPPTPLESILPFLDDLDGVLVMSVMPGFGGQEFDASVLAKVRRLRELRPALPISIDGGINPTTAADAVAAGVTQLVAGSSVFRGGGDHRQALADLAAGARRGAERGVGPAGSAGASLPA